MRSRPSRRAPRALALAAPFAAVLLAAPPAHALDPQFTAPPPGPPPAGAAPAKLQGWDGTLSLGATTTVNSNQNVVGQPEGTALTAGLRLDGLLEYNMGQQEWRNTLALGESFSRTPAIDDLVKSSDLLSAESIDYYHLVDWAGPFARAAASAPIFESRDLRPAPVTYRITRKDGTVVDVLADRLRLSDGFQPLNLKQSVGGFARPFADALASIEARAGVGMREIFAQAQRAVADDDKTKDIIEVKELQNSVEFGAEVGASLNGKSSEGRVTYALHAEALVPFVDSLKDPKDRNAFELTNAELGARVSFKLVSWASLDYELLALRLPQLVDAWQIRNNLLLTFAWVLVPRAAAPPPVPATAPGG